MKHLTLEIKHYYKDKYLGSYNLKPKDDLFVMGKSAQASLRLLGEDVSGIHAAFEYDKNRWSLMDLSSSTGTWIKKEPVLSTVLTAETPIRIGGHLLEVKPILTELIIFDTNAAVVEEKQDNEEVFQQLVVKKNSLIVSSKLLSVNESFVYKHGEEIKTIEAATSYKWQTHQFGDVTVMHRLANSHVMTATAKEKIANTLDPSLRLPMAGSVGAMLVVLLLMFLAPKGPDVDLKIAKVDTNQYTKIIFDKKLIKQKKKESKKSIKVLAKTNEKTRPSKKNQNQTVTQKTNGTGHARPDNKPMKSVSSKFSSQKTAKVINKIKASGLSQLVGKISKRASATSTLVASSGVVADADKSSGHSFASLTDVKGKGNGGEGGAKSYKMRGIATAGVGGGGTGYKKGVGGLATGNIGKGSVGFVEEETEIQGGLDRDVIAKVIKKNIGQIRYCYERQLAANPNIYGKVMVNFTIAASGKVATKNVKNTTLKNSMVEGCMLRRIARWKFPEPKGGTTVNVSYPFLFKSTN